MNRSITSILVSKILDVLESSTLSQIFTGFLLLLASIILTVVLTYTDDSLEAFRAILTWENAIIAKAIVVTLFVFNFSRIVSVLLIKFEFVLASREEIRTIDSIDGIPRLELLDHLFTVGTFKRDEVEKKWGIPRYRVTEISKKLEDLGVLVRGDNNARVLNTDFTREDIATMIDGKKSFFDIKVFTRKVENGYSHRPSGSEVMDRVSPFVTRPI
jgi:hypothetical protein